MAGKAGRSELALDVGRLQEEHKKVVKGCEGQVEHWQKIEKDYDCLQERLKTLPDQLSYDIMVPFGPLAFMPGKLVHTNEVTVLLGDNWFAKCSAKQAEKIVEHRKTHVKNTLDDLHKVVKNFEDRSSFTEDLDRVSGSKGDYVDIREKVLSEDATTKGKRRMAHKPHSKPKIDFAVDIEEVEEEEEKEDEGVKVKVTETEGIDDGDNRVVLTEEDLWAQLDALEAQEEQLDERDRMCDSTDTNGEDTSSSSSEEEKEREGTGQTNGSPEEDHGTSDIMHNRQLNGVLHTHPEEDEEDDDDDDDDEEEEDPDALPTIYFSHTVEPKKVRINTGKNTMLKFSERKEQMEQAKKKKKKNGKANGHSRHDQHHKITSPADIYRLFVDKVNGELIPRKSILKSRSRENSVCSDTSESSAADFEERRSMLGRTFSHDDNNHSDTSDYVTEEDSPPGVPTHPGSRFEAFSGTVVEKDPLPSSIPHLTIAQPALPTILERKSEELCSETPPQEPPKRVSKFKAARLQQK